MNYIGAILTDGWTIPWDFFFLKSSTIFSGSLVYPNMRPFTTIEISVCNSSGLTELGTRITYSSNNYFSRVSGFTPELTCDDNANAFTMPIRGPPAGVSQGHIKP